MGGLSLVAIVWTVVFTLSTNGSYVNPVGFKGEKYHLPLCDLSFKKLPLVYLLTIDSEKMRIVEKLI